jgi:hypothetical protein
MKSKELNWAEIKKVRDIIKVEYKDLDELIAMIYLLSDSDCRDIVTDRLNAIAESEHVQLILGLIHDSIDESVQRKILRRILTSKQSISVVERLFKHRTGILYEDIVNLWSGLSMLIEGSELDKSHTFEYITKSMECIVDYFENIKLKSRSTIKFNQARAVVIDSIRDILSVSHEMPDYSDFSLLKVGATRKIKPITLMHFYILSLAFAIKGARIFCIEDTPCLKLDNGYVYISNFPEHLFTDDSAKLLLSKHGIDVGVIYKYNSEADFVRSLLLRFYRNKLIKKSMYKFINSALEHYIELLSREDVDSVRSVE